MKFLTVILTLFFFTTTWAGVTDGTGEPESTDSAKTAYCEQLAATKGVTDGTGGTEAGNDGTGAPEAGNDGTGGSTEAVSDGGGLLYASCMAGSSIE